MPARTIRLVLLLRVDEDLHPKVEQRVWLGMVQQVEFHWLVLPRVGYFKEEPYTWNMLTPKRLTLCVPLGVDIIREYAVVLLITELVGHGEVARLEPRLKDQGPVVLVHRRVVGQHNATLL